MNIARHPGVGFHVSGADLQWMDHLARGVAHWLFPRGGGQKRASL